MRFLACRTDTNPCPMADQAWVSLSDLLDPELLGITSESILKVYAWGFGVVLASFLLGYGLSLALGLIRKA